MRSGWVGGGGVTDEKGGPGKGGGQDPLTLLSGHAYVIELVQIILPIISFYDPQIGQHGTWSSFDSLLLQLIAHRL